MNKKIQIAVIGPAGPEEYPAGKVPAERTYAESYEVGRLLAEAGCIVVTGGKSGIMEEAAKGAKTVDGAITVGVVKGSGRRVANDYIDVEIVSGAIANGLDEYQIVTMCDGLIILGGGAGTLEEITIAYRNQKPMVAITGCGGWGDRVAGSFLDDRESIRIIAADTALDAVTQLLSLLTHHTTQNSS